jgi:RNA-splicing ligase RtcB
VDDGATTAGATAAEEEPPVSPSEWVRTGAAGVGSGAAGTAALSVVGGETAEATEATVSTAELEVRAAEDRTFAAVSPVAARA